MPIERDITAETQELLEQEKLVARDFVFFIVRDRSTGNPVEDCIWTDEYDTEADFIDPLTKQIVTRACSAAGELVSISDIPLTSNLTVQTVEMILSQVSDRVNTLVRTYDCQQARVDIYRGTYDPATERLTEPAVARFTGFVDLINIVTPAKEDIGGGGVKMTLNSHTQEVMRSNPDTRSGASQRLRNASDAFYDDTGVVSEWELFWGSKKGVLPTAKKKKGFLASIFG